MDSFFDNSIDLGNLPFNRVQVFSRLPLLAQLHGPVSNYVLEQIERRDADSDFAHKAATYVSGWIPGWVKVAALRLMKYDGVLCYHDNHPYPSARIFWQEHASSGQGATANGRVDLHIFSIAVPLGFQKQGFAKFAGEVVLRHAADRKDVCAVRFGRGGGVNAHIISHLERRKSMGLLPYDFIVAPQGWVHLVHENVKARS